LSTLLITSGSGSSAQKSSSFFIVGKVYCCSSSSLFSCVLKPTCKSFFNFVFSETLILGLIIDGVVGFVVISLSNVSFLFDLLEILD